MATDDLAHHVRRTFTPINLLPVVITAPGQYETRRGEIVTVDTTAGKGAHRRNWHGRYENGVAESWHSSGRLYAGQTCANDIVRRV